MTEIVTRDADWEPDDGARPINGPALETLASWEVTYRPYPAFLEKYGFDRILGLVADVVHDRFESLSKMWGDVGLSSHFDKYIVFSIVEDETEDEKSAKEIGTLESFQDDVARELRFIGMEGHTTATRIVSIGAPV